MKTVKSSFIKYLFISIISFSVIIIVLYVNFKNYIINQEIHKAKVIAYILKNTKKYTTQNNTYINNNLIVNHTKLLNEVANSLSKEENLQIKIITLKQLSKDSNILPPIKTAYSFFQKHKNKDEFYTIVHFNSKEYLCYAYPIRVEKKCIICHSSKNNLYNIPVFKVGDVGSIINVMTPFYKIKNKINSFFYAISIGLCLMLFIVLFLFLRLNSNIRKDVSKIDNFFENYLLLRKFKFFKDDMIFKEFTIMKNHINKVVKSLREYNKMLYKNLYYNPMTELPNRKKLLKFLSKIKTEIILIDIDSFKEINYFYGEQTADELIKQIAKRIPAKRVYHIKIDTFAILPRKKFTKEEIYQYTREVLNVLEKPYELNNYKIFIKCRAGISYSRKDFYSALSALDATKILKKDIVFCSEAAEIRKEYQEHLIWIKKLKMAIENDKIVPFFQPIVDKNKNICKYEALVRLIDENDQIVSPFFFLNIAKKSRLYFDVSKIMIKKVLKIANEKEISVSINLTTQDMENENMRKYILEHLTNVKKKELIGFEIIENENINSSDKAKEFLKELKNIGCKLLIDDFGSGYANFDYLLSLGADGIKIDGSLIKNIIEDKNSQIIVQTIIDFAKKANMGVVAEYVENDEIFEYLKTIGVDCFQGYFYSPPKAEI